MKEIHMLHNLFGGKCIGNVQIESSVIGTRGVPQQRRVVRNVKRRGGLHSRQSARQTILQPEDVCAFVKMCSATDDVDSSASESQNCCVYV